jgi:hypothetical protein
MYSEMKMCLAPCFAGCTKEAYDAEVARVVSFLGSRGASLSAELERERELASEALDFEGAAAVHRRVEKAADALRGLPELARRLDDLNAVILQPSSQRHGVVVFAVRSGRIAEPRTLRFGEMTGESRSVEQILREWLEPSGDLTASSDRLSATSHQDCRELEDQLGLLARWFYGKPRVGEIFFREGAARTSLSDTQDSARSRRNSEWPYRRILRACSRILAPLAPVETKEIQ